ncbi:LacI family DNA-binding transcriptional regulator [Reichenbachiella faecimaris]|nr:LacI family DNA-binding transcriptional regulator [Reichenbachiella faecimaris]
MKKIRYTSKDIAQLANVSRGTVDRVIHNRGKVSETARNKVLKVLEEIDYQPNVIAKALSSSKEFRIAVLMPSVEKDVYWEDAKIGIDQAAKELSMYNVGFEYFYFDQKSPKDFGTVSQLVLESQPAGLVMAPFFHQESIAFIAQCETKAIPCINFNTFLPSSSFASFIGQDLVQSGRVAAGLLHKCMSDQGGTILIIHFDENISNAMHMQEKEAGFRDYFDQDHITGWRLTALNLTEKEEGQLHDHLDTIFSSFPDTKGIFVTTSKGYKVAQYLSHHELPHKLVGYDLIDKNASFLSEGIIDFLIYQNAKQQAFLSAMQIGEHLVFDKKMKKKTTLPIDIITKENILSHRQET